MKIKKGDTVKILTGKNSGKSGKIISVDLKNWKVSVEGLNVYKKHVRPRREGEKGQIVEVTRPITASNVALVCGSCHKAIRVGYRLEGENKIRYCRKCGSAL